jgi:hypothetical protein
MSALQDMAEYPLYKYPPGAFFLVGLNVFFGGHRSFRRDGRECIDRLAPPLRVLEPENIPQAGPCAIIFNHYYRPGFDAWWLALGLAAVVPHDIHFVMTGELTYPGKWYAPLGMAGSRLLLWRLSSIYGFTTMPPMPPRPKDVAARARSVRKTLKFARLHPHSILGLAPEGGDQPRGRLNWPAPGAGRFILHLAGLSYRIVPVGAYELGGEFCLHFGRAYDLTIPTGLSADQKDRAAAQVLMSHISALLPEPLRGPFN